MLKLYINIIHRLCVCVCVSPPVSCMSEFTAVLIFYTTGFSQAAVQTPQLQLNEQTSLHFIHPFMHSFSAHLYPIYTTESVRGRGLNSVQFASSSFISKAESDWAFFPEGALYYRRWWMCFYCSVRWYAPVHAVPSCESPPLINNQK